MSRLQLGQHPGSLQPGCYRPFRRASDDATDDNDDNDDDNQWTHASDRLAAQEPKQRLFPSASGTGTGHGSTVQVQEKEAERRWGQNKNTAIRVVGHRLIDIIIIVT